jgi:4-amino-4-deoxy-L-arabinose transferase-like glycosyltransferase
LDINKIYKIYSQKWSQFFLLLGFCLFFYFLNLNRWDLWNPDEPRYAQVAREMIQRGDWILMHFNGKVYADKPPLFFWLIGLSSFLWKGFTSFSVRFPAALFGTLTVLVTFLIGKSLFSLRTGFLSGLILATSFQFIYLSTRANIDTTLTFFIAVSLFCFVRWYRKLPGLDHFSIYGFFIGMALATLVKGPVGFILPLLISLTYLIVLKDWNGIKKMRLLPGMILCMAIIFSWYLPALFKGGEFLLRETLVVHTVDRFAKGWSHVHPFYYYLYNFPMNFLPWIIFLPGAIIYLYSKERKHDRKEFFFLWIWFLVVFLFFSISKGKRGLYLLPLFPATSILVGKLWDDYISSSFKSFRYEWITFPLYGWMALALILSAVLPWVVSKEFPSYFPYSLPMALFLVGGGLLLFFFNRMKYRMGLFFLIVGMVAIGFFYTERMVFPLVNPYKSARFISWEITSRIQPGGKVALYGGFGTGPYNFYTGIVPILELRTKEDLVRFLNSQERVFCLLKFRDFLNLQRTEERLKMELIARRSVGGDDIVLISNY